MISLSSLVRLRCQLSRKEFFWLVACVLLFTLGIYIMTEWLFHFRTIDHLTIRALCEFLSYIAICLLAIARLKDIEISRLWAIIILMPWFFDIRNMILFNHYFNDSQSISPSVTYLSFFVAIVSLIFIIFLLFKPGKSSGKNHNQDLSQYHHREE